MLFEGTVTQMGFNGILKFFKSRCSTIKTFIRTKKGRNLFLIACLIFVLLFFAPLFHGAVGAALVGCVGAPMLVMIWRRYDRKHVVVPAVFLCIPMIFSMIVYHSISVAMSLLVGVVAVLALAIHPGFAFVAKLEDDLYAYLSAGGVCAVIVVLASLLTLLVSVAWWLFCLFLFFAVIAVFFTVVLSSAAYMATDDKRQARKKQRREENLDYDSYDIEAFAQDIGLTNELDPDAHIQSDRSNRRKREKEEPLFYDAD